MLRRLMRMLSPPRANPEALRMTLSEWLLYHQKEVVFGRCHWMGIRTFKSPLDAWIEQEILFEVKPDLVIEIGSAVGGSTMFIANLLDVMGHGEILSLDIDRSQFEAKHPRIHTITGDSGSDDVINQVKALAEGKRCLVIHDGDHAMEPVLRDLRAYASMVDVGSYLIVEDGVIDMFAPGDGIGSDKPGPLGAIDAFLREDSRFEVDVSRERYIVTYNPRGYLKRVR